MLFIARVDSNGQTNFIRLVPTGTYFGLNTRPRPAEKMLLAITLADVATVNATSLEAWRDRFAPGHELLPQFYRPASINDLMDAVNADAFLAIAREANTDVLAKFAVDRGGLLLAELRADLAAGADPRPITGRARRFARILGVPYADTLIEDLAKLHAVEHLMGLEHAVVSWIRAATEPAADDLDLLAKQLPGERVSAGVSPAWFRWWWRLAHTCTRGDLRDIVTAAIDRARRECRIGSRNAVAADACDEAARMSDRMRVATTARMWADPPSENVDLAVLDRDETDAHYAAYMALTHAAHAIAAALRADMDAGEANRQAMHVLAELALEQLR